VIKMSVIEGGKLKEVIEREEVVIADFWAEWCVPCKAVDDLLKRLVTRLQRLGLRVVLYKVNVEENPDIAAEYGVLGLPTVILFVRGKEKLRHTGGPSGLERKILKALNI